MSWCTHRNQKTGMAMGELKKTDVVKGGRNNGIGRLYRVKDGRAG